MDTGGWFAFFSGKHHHNELYFVWVDLFYVVLSRIVSTGHDVLSDGSNKAALAFLLGYDHTLPIIGMTNRKPAFMRKGEKHSTIQAI